MPKLRVVFDTNVFVRALISPGGVNARLIEARQQYEFFTSPAIIDEVVEVLARADLLQAKTIRNVDADRLISVLRRARRVFPTIPVRVCRDPDDNKFLEAALAAKAEYLVTGDKDLRTLGEYEGIKIRYPAEFLREIAESTK